MSQELRIALLFLTGTVIILAASIVVAEVLVLLGVLNKVEKDK